MKFDNKLEVERYINNLTTLHEVIDYRHRMCYELKQRMSDFKIFNGQILFDNCGNIAIRTCSNSICDTYSFNKLPSESDKCPYCGKSFNVYNIDDIYTENDGIYYHKTCNRYNNIDIATKEFKDIFSKVYDIKELDFRAIPNQYDSKWDGYKPWFIVTTPDGKIKIGWRKRVIKIEWLDDYKCFMDNFKDERVTKEWPNIRYIHAWSSEKCIEYLQRAKDSITNCD